MDRKIAVFVDGGYFIQRINYFHRTFFREHQISSSEIVDVLKYIISKHQYHFHREDLYRIYYYDAPPFDEQMREPVIRAGNVSLATKNFKADPNVIRQKEIHSHLNKYRKLALRMGEISSSKKWLLNDTVQKQLLNGAKRFEELTPEDFHLDITQKGVDTRIGIDITTLTLNKFVDTIVLIASDADFIPAAKLARTHGVDVILDPIFSNNVAKGLERHIDGKKSFDIVRKLSNLKGVPPSPVPTWWERED